MKRFIAAVALSVLAAGAAFAQQKAPAEATNFAKKVAAANTFEIQSSQLATSKSQVGDVKSFAQQMITDHTKAGEDFKAALQKANITPPPEKPDAKQQATLNKLRGAQGKAFDKGYVDAQLKAHKEAVALFRSYAKSGKTDALKQFAEQTLPTLEHHLEMVQGLSKHGVASR
jgi:putative membrane protein